jgi:hypothetical protein
MLGYGDIELDFHDQTCGYVSTVVTATAAGRSSPRQPSSENRIYISKEMTVTEEFIAPSSTIVSCQDKAASRALRNSDQSSEMATASSVDTATVMVASMEESKNSLV